MRNPLERQLASPFHASHWRLRDFIATAALFFVTAGVVLWQNAHLVVLWDLSYVLDSAMRIALGQMPYRDFPLAHAPLTFLIQAAIIRLTGRVFFHHVLYCAIVGGSGTVLAWRIALHTLRERIGAAWGISLLLATPLTVLGIYCILPHPSYDCDCGFSILVAVFLLQRAAQRSGAARANLPIFLWRPFAAGAALVLPVFFKQNIGLPFLLIAVAAILLLLAARLAGRGLDLSTSLGTPILVAILTGATATLLVAILLLHFTAGLGNYVHWTIQFAAQRRLPGLQSMLGVYRETALLWMLTCIAAALAVLQSRAAKAQWVRLLGLGLLAAPFLWTLFSLFLYDDADERGDSLLALWPLLLILSAVLTLFNLRHGLSLRALLPATLFAAINGTLLSQQLWGSTYAIWPLLVLLIAEMIAFLGGIEQPAEAPGILSESEEGTPQGLKPPMISWLLSPRLKSCPDASCHAEGVFPHPSKPAPFTPASHPAALAVAPQAVTPVLTTVITATLLVCGGFYTASEERLSYAQMSDGPVLHSTFPQLKGMAASGPYLPEFEELLRFAEANIPATDGLILLPGEDPFYFVTGRAPRFPVLLFDPATDPYSPGQLVEQARIHKIRWLIVKRDLQIKEDPTPQREATVEALLEEFRIYRSLKGYDIYRRP